MGGKNKRKKTRKSPIKITLTTFNVDENGELSPPIESTVKIDGENDVSKDACVDCSVFKTVFVKNLLVLSLGQFLLFMAFDSLSNLQTLVNGEEDLGPVSLAVIHGGLTISSFFLPTVIIKRWGCKKTLVLATFGFCPFIIANFYPTWSSMIPTALLCGLAAGPFWTARGSYINQISHKFAKIQILPVKIVNAWFFSVSTTFRQNTEIWGNLLSHYTLKIRHQNETHYEYDELEYDIPSCGPEYCDDGLSSSNVTFSLPSDDRWYILITIFTALAFMAAFFMSYFLEPLESEQSEGTQKPKFIPSDFLATLHQLTNTDQILLLPLSFYTGLVDGFYSGDYKKAYIACTWGIPHVTAVSICYGVISSLVDIACGPCVQILGRATVFILAAIGHFSMFLALILWTPNPEHTAGFYLVATSHGIGNGIWMSQLIAFYGILFQKSEDAGFSCHYFVSSLGYLIAYSYSNYLCTRVKLYIPMVMLVIGVLSYLVVEIRIIKRTLAEYQAKRQQLPVTHYQNQVEKSSTNFPMVMLVIGLLSYLSAEIRISKRTLAEYQATWQQVDLDELLQNFYYDSK